MRVRLALAAAAVAVAAGGTLASAMQPIGGPTVTVGTQNGGVQVGTSLPNQPLVGARADRTGICFGFSYETGTCLPVALA